MIPSYSYQCPACEQDVSLKELGPPTIAAWFLDANLRNIRDLQIALAREGYELTLTTIEQEL